MITEGDQLHIRCTIQVTHMAQVFPEIIIQRDKTIVGHSKQGNEATYSVMATMKENGNYTCKVETSQISKVSSIVVNITGRGAAGRCQPIAGSRSNSAGIWVGQRRRYFYSCLSE